MTTPSREEAPERVHFDPSHREGPSWAWRHEVIAQILDLQARENADRPDFTPAISREQAEEIAAAVMAIFDCRSSDFAAVYAWMRLWEALGVDYFASKMVFKPPVAKAPTQEGPPS